MKKLNPFVIGIVVFAIVIFAYGVWKITRPPQNQPPLSEATAQTPSLLPQVNSEGAVEVAVSPLNVAKGSAAWTFGVALNTHSGSLDEDLAKVSVLKDDSGKTYLPKSWDGAPPGGHHRQGVLAFAAVSPYPRSVTLIIKNIAGVPERSFSFELPQ